MSSGVESTGASSGADAAGVGEWLSGAAAEVGVATLGSVRVIDGAVTDCAGTETGALGVAAVDVGTGGTGTWFAADVGRKPSASTTGPDVDRSHAERTCFGTRAVRHCTVNHSNRTERCDAYFGRRSG